MNVRSAVRAAVYISTADSFFVEHSVTDAGSALPDITVYPTRAARPLKASAAASMKKVGRRSRC